MRFIGLCIYIRRHIPHLQLHLKPLQATVNAFNKTGDFLWGPPQELAFNNLKSIVSQNLRLSYVPSCKEMGLYCDSSGFGGGGGTILRGQRRRSPCRLLQPPLHSPRTAPLFQPRIGDAKLPRRIRENALLYRLRLPPHIIN